MITGVGYVALFDRKQTIQACEEGVSTACYLDMARRLSLGQPLPVRFLFVVGKGSPWYLLEVDISTGKRMAFTRIAGSDWVATWERIGLLEARRNLSTWLATSEAEVAKPAALVQAAKPAAHDISLHPSWEDEEEEVTF